MRKSQINREDIIHWSSIGHDFKAYYISEEKIYELKVTLPLHIENETEALKWVESLSSRFSDEITLGELLNDDDKIMTGTNFFKKRVAPIIQKDRDKKIKTIINGN